jgi:hypothetical protein
MQYWIFRVNFHKNTTTSNLKLQCRKFTPKTDGKKAAIIVDLQA